MAVNAEGLVVANAAGLELDVAYEAIAILSGTSLSHVTESQVILNGSRDIFYHYGPCEEGCGAVSSDCRAQQRTVGTLTVDLSDIRRRHRTLGERELSPNIIRRLEDATGLDIRAPGFPAEMIDDEPEEPGYEVVPTGLHTTA